MPLERYGRTAVRVTVEVTDVERDQFRPSRHQGVGEQEEGAVAFSGERVRQGSHGVTHGLEVEGGFLGRPR